MLQYADIPSSAGLTELASDMALGRSLWFPCVGGQPAGLAAEAGFLFAAQFFEAGADRFPVDLPQTFGKQPSVHVLGVELAEPVSAGPASVEPWQDAENLLVSGWERHRSREWHLWKRSAALPG